MDQNQCAKQVGWLGTDRGCFAWLQQRIGESCTLRMLDSADQWPHALDRLIVAGPTRLDLPSQSWIRPSLPTAVAFSNWWDGSSRTGLRYLPCLGMPWYRWWDGWAAWLRGSPVEFFSPLPPRLAHSQPWCPSIPVSEANHGWVIAGCPQTAESWAQAAHRFGHGTTWLTPRQYEVSGTDDSPHPQPDWLLWDDTCLDTWRGRSVESQAAQFFLLARQRLPSVLKLMACTLPRWEIWRSAMEAGAQELIAKPTTALALGHIIASWQAAAKAETPAG